MLHILVCQIWHIGYIIICNTQKRLPICELGMWMLFLKTSVKNKNEIEIEFDICLIDIWDEQVEKSVAALSHVTPMQIYRTSSIQIRIF